MEDNTPNVPASRNQDMLLTCCLCSVPLCGAPPSRTHGLLWHRLVLWLPQLLPGLAQLRQVRGLAPILKSWIYNVWYWMIENPFPVAMTGQGSPSPKQERNNMTRKGPLFSQSSQCPRPFSAALSSYSHLLVPALWSGRSTNYIYIYI